MKGGFDLVRNFSPLRAAYSSSPGEVLANTTQACQVHDRNTPGTRMFLRGECWPNPAPDVVTAFQKQQLVELALRVDDIEQITDGVHGCVHDAIKDSFVKPVIFTCRMA